MPIWGYALGVLALVGVGFIGLLSFGGGVQAQNLTLESPSGADLAADANMLLVDIRTPEEWKQTGVVEGALLVTYSTPAAFLQAIELHLKPGQRLGLICRSGNRTSRAARQIAPLVDGRVVDVQGGMNRVLGQGYRPIKPSRAQGCQSC